MNLKLAIAGVLLAFGFATPALAAPGSWGGQGHGHGPFGGNRHHSQWELIGSQNVSFRTERDTIYARGHDRHRQLMVCVYNRPVRMIDMDVRFRNGRSQDVSLRSVIGAGECTRAIDLYGRNRDVRTVSFTYKTVGGFRNIRHFPQQAVVRVYAR